MDGTADLTRHVQHSDKKPPLFIHYQNTEKQAMKSPFCNGSLKYRFIYSTQNRLINQVFKHTCTDSLCLFYRFSP